MTFLAVCRRRRPALRAATLAGLKIGCGLIALASGGCWSGGDAALLPVVGSVTYNGSPLVTGTVSFRPDSAAGNQSQHHPTGSIDAQGRYRLYTAGRPGAPPGAYKVVVFASEQTKPSANVHPGLPKSLIPKRYNDFDSTPLAVEVAKSTLAKAYELQLER